MPNEELMAVDWTDEDVEAIMHYGTPRHSGRYPWGSGQNPKQRNKRFNDHVRELRKEGMSEADIAKTLGMSINEFRAQIAKEAEAERKAADNMIYRMAYNPDGSKNMSVAAISRATGIPDSTIRAKLKRLEQPKEKLLSGTAEALKEAVDRDRYIDVGKGINSYLGCTEDRMKKAVKILEEEGYQVYSDLRVKQLGTGNYTNMKILCQPDVTKKEAFEHLGDVKLPFLYSEDGGVTYRPKEPIENIDLSRVMVRWPEDGGAERDGTIEIRRGVEDLDMGPKHYCQVRIGVDASDGEKLGYHWNDGHAEKVANGEAIEGKVYLKGVAVYGDDKDFPPGVDVIFNTSKKKGSGLDKVFKEQKPGDPSNPFGASIKVGDTDEDMSQSDDGEVKVQRHYMGKDGKEHLSALNIVNEEGDWDKWSRNLPSQFLGKQDPKIAKKQLDIDYDMKMEEFNKLNSLTNPHVKEAMMLDFADGCDSAAVHLKAAALPRQKTHLLLPSTTLNEGEIYAPNYEDGEKLALVRFPHEGKHQIPILTVKNSDPTGKKMIGNGRDAVAINAKDAEKLSGADFDGDTAIVIPLRSANIKSEAYNKAFDSLRTFDAKEAYPERPGMKYMKKTQYGNEMGKISNLITDMTIKGASPEELIRATRHSNCVIDAYKHKLDYKRSEEENGIAELKKKYQYDEETDHVGGTSTLLSRNKSQVWVPQRKTYYDADPVTGEKIFKYTNETKVVPAKNSPIDPETGKPTKWVTEPREIKSTKMYEAKDAHSLSSGRVVEEVYADYANKMKALGDKARVEWKKAQTENITPIANAKDLYKKEVESVKNKVELARRNAPIERQALLLANKTLAMKKEANPDWDKAKVKKMGNAELTAARQNLGIDKYRISLDAKEWEAIQAGAVNKTTQKELFKRMNSDELKKLATPVEKKELSKSTKEKIKSLSSNGYTNAEIANYLGLSTDTVGKYT